MEPTAHALARTYSDRVYPDPWEKVLDHRRVMEYAAEHPNAGRTRVGSALDLPPSRVRGWLNGGIPDPVRGVNTAIDYGWVDPDDDTSAALLALLGHILAGGSVTAESYVPAVALADRVDGDAIRRAYERVGVGSTTRHEAVDGRATEFIPNENASVLGRCLDVMGAPLGNKSDLTWLPSIVWDAPVPVRKEFVQIYLRHRAPKHPGKATLQLHEERPQSYFEDLHTLLLDLTDEPVSLNDGSITISASAVRDLSLS